MDRAIYSAWIKIDDSLPWVELKEAFRTKTEAKEAMKQKLGKVQIKIVEMGQTKTRTKTRLTKAS